MIDSRDDRNQLRKIIMAAEDGNIVSQDELGFIVSLVERFRRDVDKKTKQLYLIQGEIAQLKANEAIIINLIENLIAAAERDKARQSLCDSIKNDDDD